MKTIQGIVAVGLVLGGAIACTSEMPIGESTGQGKGALGAVGQPPKADGSCDPRLTLCGGTCRDLSLDESNCGTCGAVCEDSATCSSGVCSSAPPPPLAFSPPPSPPVHDGGPAGCGAGRTLCGAECVDLLLDEANCGACGHACASGTTCTSGVCL